LAVAGDLANESRLAEARKLAEDPAAVSRKGRSRVTNGKSLFVEFDGRGPWTRRWRDVLNQILDLACPNGATETQRQDARRAATMIIECEKMEGRVAAGEDINHDEYGKLSDRLGRIYRRLGLKQPNDEPKGRTFGQVLVEDYERRQMEGRIREEEKQRAERSAEEPTNVGAS
jgi:hypothetical protein